MARSGWSTYLRKAVRVGSDVADVAVHLRGGVSPIGIASAGMRLVNCVLDLHPETSAVDGWKRLVECTAIRLQVFGLLGNSGALRPVPSSKDGEVVLEWSVGPVAVRWVVDDDPSRAQCPYVREGQEESARQAIRDLLWAHGGPQTLIRSKRCRNFWEENVEVEPDTVGEARPSQTADDLWARLQPFVRLREPIAALLHGPRGTGKSCIARRVAELSGGRTLRVQARSLESDDLVSTVRFLQPAAVVVDDLDRAGGSHLLDVLDEIRRHALLLVSVNAKEKLDAALLRPGRFDEMVEVKTLDETVLDGLLADVPADDATRLRVLPVAYIRRYLELRAKMGRACASAEVARLELRHELVERQASTVTPEPKVV